MLKEKLKQEFLNKGYAAYEIDLDYCDNMTDDEIKQEIEKVKKMSKLAIGIEIIINENKLTNDQNDFSDFYYDVESDAESEFCADCEYCKRCHKSCEHCDEFYEQIDDLFKQLIDDKMEETMLKMRKIYENDTNNTIIETYNKFRADCYNIAPFETMTTTKGDKWYADLDDLKLYTKDELYYNVIENDDEFIKYVWKNCGGLK